MNRLGIEKWMFALSKNDNVEAGLDGERDIVQDNIDCLKRLLNEFIPRAFEAYKRMNEYFERKAMNARKMEFL
jgi:hypothetical protein